MSYNFKGFQKSFRNLGSKYKFVPNTLPNNNVPSNGSYNNIPITHNPFSKVFANPCSINVGQKEEHAMWKKLKDDYKVANSRVYRVEGNINDDDYWAIELYVGETRMSFPQEDFLPIDSYMEYEINVYVKREGEFVGLKTSKELNEFGIDYNGMTYDEDYDGFGNVPKEKVEKIYDTLEKHFGKKEEKKRIFGCFCRSCGEYNEYAEDDEFGLSKSALVFIRRESYYYTCWGCLNSTRRINGLEFEKLEEFEKKYTR